MTNREFFEAIAANEALAQDLRDFATEGIVKLDRKNEQRRSSESKTEKENKPLREAILDFMADNEGETFLTADIAKQFGYSSQKASALLRQLVAANKLEVTEVKVKNKGTQKGYFFSVPVQALDNEITV